MQVLREIAFMIEASLAPLVRGAAQLVLALIVFGVLNPPRGCSKEKAYLAAMRSDLRNVVDMQEAQRAQGGPFLYELPADGPQRLSTGVSLAIMLPSEDGLLIAVDYPGGTDQRCQVRHRWGSEPVPRCDRMR